MKDAYDDFGIKLDAFAAQFSPPLQVAYPGIPFTPPSAGPWLEASWMPNRSENYGISDDGPTLEQGMAQVMVCERPGQGLISTLDLDEQVIAAFNKGTMLGPVRVYVRPYAAAVLEEPERIAVPVTIPWRGFV